MKTPLTLSTLAAAALLAACAIGTAPPPELISARSVVRDAELEPNVLNYAPVELKKATESLNRANTLEAKGGKLADVASAAYVAERQAQVAMAIAKAKGNDEAIKGAEADRERARADARAADARRAQGQAAVARADASNARADASIARDQAMTAQQQADAARSQTDAARMQAADAQASAAAARTQAAALQAQLNDLQAKQTDRGMLVTLGDVLFEFGRADIKPGAQESLRKLSSYLQQHPERNVLIEGFTDSVGTESANMVLSQRRAEAVASALAGLGVAPGRVDVKGYGKSYPIADNSTDTNRALNRRVEVYISDNDKPVRARS